jgi:hypothetical protein
MGVPYMRLTLPREVHQTTSILIRLAFPSLPLHRSRASSVTLADAHQGLFLPRVPERTLRLWLDCSEFPRHSLHTREAKR